MHAKTFIYHALLDAILNFYTIASMALKEKGQCYDTKGK